MPNNKLLLVNKIARFRHSLKQQIEHNIAER